MFSYAFPTCNASPDFISLFGTRLPRNPELPASTGLEIHLLYGQNRFTEQSLTYSPCPTDELLNMTQLTLIFPDFGLCRGMLHTMTTP